MNQGLKKYSKLVQHAVGNVGMFSINTCEGYANAHLSLPIIKTIGHNPIKLSLIFNYLEKDLTSDYGKGFRLNFYNTASLISSGIRVMNADGSYDDYIYDGEKYYNKKTKLTCEYTPGITGLNTYTLVDNQGNTKTLNNIASLPTRIESANGNAISFNLGTSISNGKGDVISISKSSNLVTFTYTNNNTILNVTKLVLNDSKLSKIEYYEGSNTLLDEVLVTYTSNEILVKDNIRKNITKLELSLNKPLYIYDGFENEEGEDTFEDSPDKIFYYQGYKTVVSDKFGGKVTYYFDADDLPLFEEDKYGGIKKYSYDKETFDLLVTEPIYTNSMNNLMRGININSFSLNDMQLSPFDFTNGYESINELFDDNMKVIQGLGGATRTIDVSGKAGDVISLSFMMGYFSNTNANVQASLMINSEEGEVHSIQGYRGIINLYTIHQVAKEDFDEVTVGFSFPANMTVKIGAFTLMKNNSNVVFSYAGENLEEVRCGRDNANISYNTDNNISEFSTSDGTSSNITYNANKRISTITNEAETVKYIGYDSVHHDNVIEEKMTSADGNYSVGVVKEYTTDGRFVNKEYDTRGYATTYTRDSYGRVTQVKDALNVVLNKTYYQNMLKTLTMYTDNTASILLNYDSRRRLSSVISDGGGVYYFAYNYKNELTSVSIGNTLMVTFEYDEKGNIKKITHSQETASFEFTYNDDNLITAIKYGGQNKYTFTYDSYDRLSSVLDLENNATKVYTYDEKGQVKSVQETLNNITSKVEYDTNNENKCVAKARRVQGVSINESFNDLKPKKELYNNKYGNVKNANFIQGNIDTYGSSVERMFDIIPLHTTTLTNLGGTPSKEKMLSASDKSLFTYNAFNKRYCFDGSKGNLTYSTDIDDDGTIVFRVFVPSTSVDQRIITLSNNTYLRMKANRTLEFYCSYVHHQVGTIAVDTWNTIAISLDCLSSKTDSQTGMDYDVRTYRIRVNDSIYYVDEITPETYQSLSFQIGSDSSNGKVFNGQIEMVATRSSYCETSTLTSLFNILDCVSYKADIDEFDRITTKEVYTSNKSIVENGYWYKSRYDSYNSTSFISMEEIRTNGSLLTRRYYTYDSVGRVTDITDSYFGSKTYTYNKQGFLVNDGTSTYTYNDNGDVLSAGGVTFTYQGAFGDQLTKVGNKVITYCSNNPYLPSSYDGYTYSWEGKRLKSVTKNGVTHSYGYNEQGLRIKKTCLTGTSKTYFYDGDRLITEIWNDGTRLDFLYDASNTLIGLVLDNTTRYFYVRDVLQNILGLVDENGTLVVQYSCSSFGVNTIEMDNTSSEIGSLNPFRFKGYYYDEETQLYWVSSRYYSPELCRFISPDDVSYLDPNSINGLNLYSYCYNNPISYYDPSGHFVIPHSAKIIDGIQKFFIKMIKSFIGIGDTYETMEEAVVAWGNEYYPKTISDHKERGAIIRSIEKNGKKYYYVGKTRKGFEATCWNAFVFGLMDSFGNVEGFVHTHTAYPNDNGTWNPVDYGPSDTDLWLFNVPGINRQFIANEQGQIYEFFEDGTMIIIQPQGG